MKRGKEAAHSVYFYPWVKLLKLPQYEFEFSGNLRVEINSRFDLRHRTAVLQVRRSFTAKVKVHK